MNVVPENWNDFSYWYPRIRDCGIPQPKTVVIKLPDYHDSELSARLYQSFYFDNYAEDIGVIRDFAEKNVIPQLEAKNMRGHLFVKNGRFSNKFDAAKSCEIFGLHELAEHIGRINYESICCDAGGETEIVVREYIEFDRGNTPCIYNGLPLRPELRVFYDFDSKKVLFAVNYWDYDYVRPHLYYATDKIVFDHERERIEKAVEAMKPACIEMVEEAMSNVTGLTGAWSIDLLQSEDGKIWLIDMAVAERSAYWDMRPGAPKEDRPEPLTDEEIADMLLG